MVFTNGLVYSITGLFWSFSPSGSWGQERSRGGVAALLGLAAVVLVPCAVTPSELAEAQIESELPPSVPNTATPTSTATPTHTPEVCATPEFTTISSFNTTNGLLDYVSCPAGYKIVPGSTVGRVFPAGASQDGSSLWCYNNGACQYGGLSSILGSACYVCRANCYKDSSGAVAATSQAPKRCSATLFATISSFNTTNGSRDWVSCPDGYDIVPGSAFGYQYPVGEDVAGRRMWSYNNGACGRTNDINDPIFALGARCFAGQANCYKQ